MPDLKSFVERIEKLNEEKKSLSQDIRDIVEEAKSSGFDAKALREVIKLRKMKPSERKATVELVDTYMVSLGMV